MQTELLQIYFQVWVLLDTHTWDAVQNHSISTMASHWA